MRVGLVVAAVGVGEGAAGGGSGGLGAIAAGPVPGVWATHVLLPVTLLARRGYAAWLVWSALVHRGRGLGHRRVAAAVGVPVTTVRDWLRRMGGRLGGPGRTSRGPR